MKAKLINITAKISQLKLNFDGGHSWKFETYISTLNYVYGYQLLDNGPISVIPEDLLCPIKDLNTIVYKLREYFETILDCQVTFKFDEKEFNGQLCGGFGIYGNSHITINRQQLSNTNE